MNLYSFSPIKQTSQRRHKTILGISGRITPLRKYYCYKMPMNFLKSNYHFASRSSGTNLDQMPTDIWGDLIAQYHWVTLSFLVDLVEEQTLCWPSSLFYNVNLHGKASADRILLKEIGITICTQDQILNCLKVLRFSLQLFTLISIISPINFPMFLGKISCSPGGYIGILLWVLNRVRDPSEGRKEGCWLLGAMGSK
jgi:hypothetical protein